MSNKKSNVIKSFNYDSSRMDLGVQFKNGQLTGHEALKKSI